MPYPNTHTPRLRQEREIEEKMALRMHCSCILCVILLLFHLKSCCCRSQTMSAPPPSSINTWTCEILDTHSQPHSSHLILIHLTLNNPNNPSETKKHTHEEAKRTELQIIIIKKLEVIQNEHIKNNKTKSKKCDKTTKMRTVTHGHIRKQKPTTTAGIVVQQQLSSKPNDRIETNLEKCSNGC